VSRLKVLIRGGGKNGGCPWEPAKQGGPETGGGPRKRGNFNELKHMIENQGEQKRLGGGSGEGVRVARMTAGKCLGGGGVDATSE